MRSILAAMSSAPTRWLHRLWAHVCRHHEWYWVFPLYALAVALLYREIWHAHGRPTAFGWDAIDGYEPDLTFLSRELAAGRFPMWNPFDQGGYPVTGDPQLGRLYPFNWPFVGLGALLGSPWWLIHIKILAHHAVLGTTMHAFIRSRRLPRIAALAAGVAAIATAPIIIHKASNVLWPMVWTPLVWIAIDAVVARPGWRRGAGLAATLYLIGSVGSPPGFFYTLLLALPYGVFRLVSTAVAKHRANELRPFAIKVSIALAVAAAISAAMLAIVLIPASELVAFSDRAGKLGRGWALSGPMLVDRTLQSLVLPSTHPADPYLGLGALLFIVIGLATAPRRDHGAAILFVIVGAIALMMACGEAGKILPWLVDHVPGFKLFRIANRYKLLTSLCGAAAVGYGVAALVSAPRNRWREVAIVIGVAIVAVAGVAALILLGLPKELPAAARPVTRPLFFICVFACAAVTMVWVDRRGATLVGILILPLLLLDADHFLHKKGPIIDPRPRLDDEPALVEALADTRSEYRLYDEYILGERAGSRLGLRDFRGYPAIDPLAMKRYLEVLRALDRHPTLLAAFNVKYILYRPHFRFGMGSHMLKRLPTGSKEIVTKSTGIYVFTHPAPHLAYYPGATVASGTAAVLDTLGAASAQGIHLAVIEASDRDAAAAIASLPSPAVPTVSAPLPPTASAGESLATITSFAPDRIEGTVHAPTAGLVVLNEVHYPGWRLTVDGVSTPMFRVNHLLRGALVAQGTHTLVWRFAPPHRMGLRLAYWLGVAALLAAWLLRRRAAPGIATPPRQANR